MSEFRLFGEPEGGISGDHADLTNVTPDQHHAQLHKAAHVVGGGDAFGAGDLLDATARLAVRKNSGAANVGARRRLNLIEGANVTLTVADDPANEEVDVTVAAAAGGGGISLLDKNLATVNVVNTTVETSIYSFTIAAGELGTTGGVRLTLTGTYLNNTLAASSITIRVKLGATTVMASNPWDVGTSASRRKWTWTFWFFNNGVANAQKWGALLLTAVVGVANALEVAMNNERGGTAFATSAEDTSLARTLNITVQHGTANPAISLQKEIAFLEKLP